MADEWKRPGRTLLMGTLLTLPMLFNAGCIIELEPDQDGDRYPARRDCDDRDASVHPLATEVCDGRDNDCDGLIDDADADALPGGTSLWYADQDGDLYGDVSSPFRACALPVGHVADGRDCDDRDATVHPGVLERCDGRDNDCDGMIDDADMDSTPEGVLPWYADVDGDSYGNAASIHLSCVRPEGFVAAGATGLMDCDDTAAAIHPGANELCDSLDNDCDGQVDDSAAQAALWYADIDQDGHGDESRYVTGCPGPSGWTTLGGDCNDLNAASYTGALEVCDGLDNDCDGAMDEEVTGQWYPDQDGDGYGTASGAVSACQKPVGYAAQSGDCDDASSTTWPGAPILCDGRDDDCDGDVDSAATPYFRDQDADGFGDVTNRVCSAQKGYVLVRGDCDDADPDVHPGGIDPGDDGIDQDCGGTEGPEPHVGLSSGSSSSIQAALNTAREGVIVWVGPGTYFERDVAFSGKGLTLISTHGAGQTVLDVQHANGNGFIFNSNEGADSVLDGFGVTGVGGGAYRVAIYVVASSPTLANCRIYGNYVLNTGNGAGLYMRWSSAVVRDCLFENNHVAYAGGGVYVDTSSPTFERCTFADNSAQWGGGMYALASRPLISECVFSDNLASSSAGGIYLNSSSATIRHSRISDNIGGGLFAYSDDSSVSHSEVSGNEGWGAASSDGSETLFENCALVNNDGVALIFRSSSSQVNNCLIRGNRSSTSGGGVWISGGAPAFLNTLIAGNESLEDGGAVYVYGGEPRFRHCVLAGNSAAGGCGGIRTEIYNTTGVTLSDSILAYNTGYNVSDELLVDLEATYSVFYSRTGQNLDSTDETLEPSNLLIEPGFLTYDSEGLPLDFHLAADSPLIDGGDPSSLDLDGTMNDPGIYGGHAGGSWDLDSDGYPGYFWPGPFSWVPFGIDPAGYDSDDSDPAIPLEGDY